MQGDNGNTPALAMSALKLQGPTHTGLDPFCFVLK
jgi:hypothetical protein